MINIQPAVKSKTDRVNVYLVLIFMAALSGCDLTYQSINEIPFDAEYAWVAPDFSPDANSLEELQYQTLTSEQLFNFEDGGEKLLIRVQLTDHDLTGSEYTLSLIPKYFTAVSHFQLAGNAVSPLTKQRQSHHQNRHFSSQFFAFNVNDADWSNDQFVLVEGGGKRYIKLLVSETNSYIRADSQYSQFVTVIYSIILALALVNLVFFSLNHDKVYLLYGVYMLFALYSLLWQEGKINDIPFLAWHVLGDRSNILFAGLSDLAANVFFYYFLQLNHRNSWLVKIIFACVGIRILMILMALFQYHTTGVIAYQTVAQVFNLSIILSSTLMLVIMVQKTMAGFPQAKYILIGWGIMIVSILARVVFISDPKPHLLWLGHLYELGIMAEGLILAFAIANRTNQVQQQRDQAMTKANVAERSIFKHQIISQFHHQMQEMVKDVMLSASQVKEKTNIKFHLLLNRALPIKHSFLMKNQQLSPFCSTGLHPKEIEQLETRLLNIPAEEKLTYQQLRFATKSGQSLTLLILDLEDQQHLNAALVLSLKHSDPVNSYVVEDMQAFAQEAYESLLQSQEIHQVAMNAHLDSLTKVYNRKSIEQVIRNSLQKAHRTTVAFIDLDNLKDINDQHGHDIGDQCIVGFIQVLSRVLNQKARVGRMGGDEFIVVFSGLDFEPCELMMEEFMLNLNEQTISDAQLHISTSVGMAESRLKDNKSSLIKKADLALYHAKQHGRNQLVIYDASMRDVMKQSG